jgi:ligand-binding sensor domain-containing protein
LAIELAAVKHSARLLIAIMCATVFSVPALAVDLHNVLSDYSITSWNRKDGLPAGSVRSIGQDSEGFLWIGGDFGLLQFDGVRFIAWDTLAPASVRNPPIHALLIARRHRVGWIR